MARPRKVQTPGLQPAADPPGVDTNADDLAAYDTEELPPATGSDVQIALAAEVAARRRLERRLAELERSKADKPGKPAPEVVSLDEAKRLAADDIKAGKRPRARLTPDGWYVHPEAARIAGGQPLH